MPKEPSVIAFREASFTLSLPLCQKRTICRSGANFCQLVACTVADEAAACYYFCNKADYGNCGGDVGRKDGRKERGKGSAFGAVLVLKAANTPLPFRQSLDHVGG